MDRDALLHLYDTRLRVGAETAGGRPVARVGPLHLVAFPGGWGFVTYADLAGADRETLDRWADEVLARFRAAPEVTDVEWKTRGHDHAPDLPAVLTEHGFVAGEVESVMLGPAGALAVDVPLPDGVTVRRVTDEADVRAMSAMADRVFGDPVSDRRADDLLVRLAAGTGAEAWVAEADGGMVSAGRLEPVPGTEVAGIWGGCTVPHWRGRGVYRAVTAARARSALAQGRTVLHSDSTEGSRPILERSGFVRVTTTTPYEWTRP